MDRRRALGIGAVVVLTGMVAAGLILLTDGNSSARREFVTRPLGRGASQASRHARERTPSTALPPATGGTPRPTRSASILVPGARASFETLARSLPAEVGMAVGPISSGGVEQLGELQLGHAWSSFKVPILVTLMGEGRLSPEEERWATEALTASDNSAAADLFDQLERAHGGLSGASDAVQEVLARGGSASTTVATAPPPPGAVSTWGQTMWSASGAVQFYRALARGCLLSSAGTEYVIGLMENVIPEQRWGLGEAGFPSDWQVAMKGGWGPENGTGRYLVRQSGFVRHGDTGFAVAMIAKDNSGSYPAGAQDLTRMATWLHEHLNAPLPPIVRGCG